MLLRRDAGRLRGSLAKTEEPPERVTKRGQRFILRFDELPGSSPSIVSLTVAHPKANPRLTYIVIRYNMRLLNAN